jgi:hypothetical protein
MCGRGHHLAQGLCVTKRQLEDQLRRYGTVTRGIRCRQGDGARIRGGEGGVERTGFICCRQMRGTLIHLLQTDEAVHGASISVTRRGDYGLVRRCQGATGARCAWRAQAKAQVQTCRRACQPQPGGACSRLNLGEAPPSGSCILPSARPSILPSPLRGGCWGWPCPTVGPRAQGRPEGWGHALQSRLRCSKSPPPSRFRHRQQLLLPRRPSPLRLLHSLPLSSIRSRSSHRSSSSSAPPLPAAAPSPPAAAPPLPPSAAAPPQPPTAPPLSAAPPPLSVRCCSSSFRRRASSSARRRSTASRHCSSAAAAVIAAAQLIAAGGLVALQPALSSGLGRQDTVTGNDRRRLPASIDQPGLGGKGGGWPSPSGLLPLGGGARLAVLSVPRCRCWVVGKRQTLRGVPGLGGPCEIANQMAGALRGRNAVLLGVEVKWGQEGLWPRLARDEPRLSMIRPAGASLEGLGGRRADGQGGVAAVYDAYCSYGWCMS